MTKVDVNSIKIREQGQDVVKLAIEYKQLISDMFKRMYQVPTVTNEWIGNASVRYAELVLAEKEDYILYGESLRKCGEALINYADSVEEITRNTRGVN